MIIITEINLQYLKISGHIAWKPFEDAKCCLLIFKYVTKLIQDQQKPSYQDQNTTLHVI